MNEVIIRKKVKKLDDLEQVTYQVTALSIKNSKNDISLQLPHPQGTSTLEYFTLEEAIVAIKKAGFEYIIPEGESVSQENIEQLLDTKQFRNNLEETVFNHLAKEVNNINVSVATSAIMGLAELRLPQAIDIFLEKMGEDNEKIRTTSIDALAEYQEKVVDILIDTLTDSNWVKRNSAITCLTKISNSTELEAEKVLIPIINRISDSNQVVQANALYSAGKIYSTQQSFKQENFEQRKN